MNCQPNTGQTSPDCTQIRLMGEYGKVVYGERGDDTGNHPTYAASTSSGAQYGSPPSGVEDAAIPTCAGIIITLAAILAMLMIRAGGRRRR